MAGSELKPALKIFSELPLETRLRRTCRACSSVMFSDIDEALAFVTGPPDQPIMCPVCGWDGVK